MGVGTIPLRGGRRRRSRVALAAALDGRSPRASDDELLERARSVAGTVTVEETVNVALRRLVDEVVRRHVARLRRGVLDQAAIEKARRPRMGR